MTRYLLTIPTLFLCFLMNAQDPIEEHHSFVNDFKLFQKAKFTGVILDCDYMNGAMKGVNSNGMFFSFLCTFNNWYSTGISMDELYSHNIIMSDRIVAINPRFNLATYNWRNEFIIGSKWMVNFSVPIDLGIGRAIYSDEYYNVNQARTIADANFFVGAAGINLNVNLFKHMALNLGARYRVAYGAARIGTDMDFTDYTLTAGLRWRIFESDFKSGQGKN